MTDDPAETRGLPPSRPLPSQLMHLLELTRFNENDAANVLCVARDTIERWMTFNSRDLMPPAHWLLLNLYTLAVKGRCWSKGVEDYVRARFPGAIADAIKPRKKLDIPASPPLPHVDAIIDLLDNAGATLEEVAFSQKNSVNAWLGPEKKYMPYAVYELTVMTLWARGTYTPTAAMAEYIEKKYNGVFNPGR